MTFKTISDLQFLSNLLLAAGLGAIIGTERQWRQRMAGLRTNALVAAGAAIYAMLSDAGSVAGDATRIPAQIVSGVGFIGAGVIMKEGLSVRGLNTAATLWCSSAVGCLAGYGLTFKSVTATLVVLGANVVLRPIAQKMKYQPKEANEAVA